MKFQIGLYNETDTAVDQFFALIDLECAYSARDLLNALTPFLKEFHCAHGMDDTQALAAWLPWHLIEVGREEFEDLGAIGINRQIDAHIDFFIKLSPGLVEVFRIDELLEWHVLAQVEITCESIEVSAYEVGPGATGDHP
jgi:hypothetical protein